MIKRKELLTKYPNLQFNSEAFDIKVEYQDGMIVKTIRPLEKVEGFICNVENDSIIDEAYYPRKDFLQCEDVTVVYYWCHGCLESEDIERIENIIESKDYEAFLSVACQMPKDTALLPDLVSLFIGDTPLGFVEMDQYLFERIDHQESEIG